MTNLAIRAEHLSKQYPLGGRPHPSGLRQAIAGAFRRKPQPSDSSRVHGHKQALWALRDVTFEVAAGEMVALIGDNGCGKTTLLQILSRITLPSSGSAQVRGVLRTLLDAGAGFHGELSGRDNVFLQASLHGMSRREIARRFDSIVAFSELEPFLDMPLKRYSTGMCVRLAFAVAANAPADVVLVDEVLTPVDGQFQRKCLAHLTNAVREGSTVIVVSHDMEFLSRCCTRALVFQTGCLVYQGPISDALRHYTSRNFSADDSPRQWAESPSSEHGVWEARF